MCLSFDTSPFCVYRYNIPLLFIYIPFPIHVFFQFNILPSLFSSILILLLK